jgi:hypothetical protein
VIFGPIDQVRVARARRRARERGVPVPERKGPPEAVSTTSATATQPFALNDREYRGVLGITG